ncbi:MAG: hypothetical protein ACRC8W_19145 [Plesiomonas shigelloides]
MKKGQMVKCVKSYVSWLTTGRIYKVLAGCGDACLMDGDTIEHDEGMNVTDDDGDVIFVMVDGVQGLFEPVDDGGHDA